MTTAPAINPSNGELEQAEWSGGMVRFPDGREFPECVVAQVEIGDLPPATGGGLGTFRPITAESVVWLYDGPDDDDDDSDSDIDWLPDTDPVDDDDDEGEGG